MDHGLPGLVTRMDRQFTENDQSTPPLGPTAVIGNVPVVQPSLPAKIGTVGQKADTVGQRNLAEG